MHEAILKDDFDHYESEVQLNTEFDVITMRLYTSAKGKMKFFISGKRTREADMI